MLFGIVARTRNRRIVVALLNYYKLIVMAEDTCTLVCDECGMKIKGKAYGTHSAEVVAKDNLKQHKKTHDESRTKDFHCDRAGCNKSYYTQKALNRHIESAHGKGKGSTRTRHHCPHAGKDSCDDRNGQGWPLKADRDAHMFKARHKLMFRTFRPPTCCRTS